MQRGRSDKRDLYKLVSSGAAFKLRRLVMADHSLIGQTKTLWVPADDDVDMLIKGHINRPSEGEQGRFSDKQIAWIDTLQADGKIRKQFNRAFFTAGDSREPELAGIWGAACGSFFTLIITLLLSFPIGVASAVYLEEFAPKNRWTDLIEVNINNLAAVPSIVFGLLGLAVFLNAFGLPRSAPLVGGLVLTLMTLPTIIIASRASLQSVPPSIRDAALGGRCFQNADDCPPRAAPGLAGHAHGNHHRHGAGPGRDGTAADDRHGGLYRGYSPGIHRSVHGAAGSDLSLGGQPRAGLCGTHIGGDFGAAGVSHRHERTGGNAAEKI